MHDALVDLSPFEPLEGVLRADYSGGSRSPHVSQIRMIQGGPDAFVVIQDWAEMPDLRPGAVPEEAEGPPDLTGETIALYHFGDLSGPYAAITAPLIHGAEDAVAAVNEAGGVYGAELEIKFADTAGSIDEAVAAYDRFTGEDDNPLVMITYGSGEVEALAGRFAQDEIVNISAGLSAQRLLRRLWLHLWSWSDIPRPDGLRHGVSEGELGYVQAGGSWGRDQAGLSQLADSVWSRGIDR